MNDLRVISVVGARPNFMKIAPFSHAIKRHNAAGPTGVPQIEHLLVHTGQHYDAAMSDTFFKALQIPEPAIDLGIGSGSHAEQVGQTMIAFEKVIRDWKPDWIVVVGDVNATCACSITAKKEHVKLAHIEAGLRSFDLEMPEEINRMVTDRLADLLFTTDEIADQNLVAEGTAPKRIARVGNIMIDTLESHRDEAVALRLPDILTRYALNADRCARTNPIPDAFALMTLHRPSNVDSPESLGPLMAYIIDELTTDLPLIWPLHPRTAKNLKDFGLWEPVSQHPRITLLNPVGYLEMLKLNMEAAIMLTDSGGLQEECCIFGTPCLTLRWNTERPKTLVEHGGASLLVGNDVNRIREGLKTIRQKPKAPHIPPLWDGHTAPRIITHLTTVPG